METYTAEQLAEMVINFNSLMDILKYGENFLKSGLFENPAIAAFESKIKIMQHENDCLQSEVEKYREAFEDAKKERDCQIAEFTDEKESLEKRLKLLKSERDDLREEVEKLKKAQDFSNLTPIEVANMLINAEGEYEHNPIAKALCGEDKGTYRIFGVSELRQIAEHLLVYCNNQKENVNE